MIIVEGPDGAGKTTLAARLSSELGLTIGQRATADRDKLYEVTREDTYAAISDACNATMAPQIWDRLGPISDPIYAPVQGREEAFSAWELKWCHKMISVIGCPIVVCLPPVEVVKGNVEKSKQMEGVKDNVDHIYKEYGTFFTNNPGWPPDRDGKVGSYNLMWYDYTDTQVEAGYVQYERLIKGLEYYLEKRKERSL